MVAWPELIRGLLPCHLKLAFTPGCTNLLLTTTGAFEDKHNTIVKVIRQDDSEFGQLFGEAYKYLTYVNYVH